MTCKENNLLVQEKGQQFAILPKDTSQSNFLCWIQNLKRSQQNDRVGKGAVTKSYDLQDSEELHVGLCFPLCMPANEHTLK